MTASDPTDLIREADEHHYVAECTESTCAGCQCAACGLEWPCEVRRLRDALEAERREVAAVAGAGANSESALAEANATIERVEATCDDLDRMNQDTPGMPHANYNREIRRNVVARIRRAIEGPAI